MAIEINGAPLDTCNRLKIRSGGDIAYHDVEEVQVNGNVVWQRGCAPSSFSYILSSPSCGNFTHTWTDAGGYPAPQYDIYYDDGTLYASDVTSPTTLPCSEDQTFDFHVYAWNRVGGIESNSQSSICPSCCTPGSREFTTPGYKTWTVPDGVTSLTIVGVGAGGGGGADSDQSDAEGSGGGGYAGKGSTVTLTVESGQLLGITIGTGGAGGQHPYSNANGRSGTATTIVRNGTTLFNWAGGAGGVGYTDDDYAPYMGNGGTTCGHRDGVRWHETTSDRANAWGGQASCSADGGCGNGNTCSINGSRGSGGGGAWAWSTTATGGTGGNGYVKISWLC